MTTKTITEQFGSKIKTAAELRVILGDLPRDKKAIMCHGVFDVVHPGHLRHLVYAKSKADILVTSLTADRHIKKGAMRPHVPEDLRAANLAAYEIVDYVVIDPNETPLENLKIIQPDYFIKGYEYNASGSMNPKTAEEASVVEAYGGSLIFSPGDIVYSSSALINLAPPSIGDDKLLAVMEREKVTFDSLRDTLKAMAGKTVHVVGDTIIDSITDCAMIGGQTKTPTMSVKFNERADFVGGAGIVAKHLQCAGANVIFTTLLGEDEWQKFAIKDLEDHGVKVNAIVDATRPTTNKNAIVVGGYRLLKVDTLENTSINDEVLEQFQQKIEKTECDALVYSDFRHGIFNKRTIPHFISALPEGVYKVADSQVASRWGNITEFKGFDLITPNEREARFALADQDSGIRPLSSSLYDASECKVLILKLGDRGVLTCQDKAHEDVRSFFTIDSFVDRVVDAVGAGDALLAYATLAHLAGGNPASATILGSMAAACEVERDGNIPIEPDFVMDKINTVEKRVNYQ